MNKIFNIPLIMILSVITLSVHAQKESSEMSFTFDLRTEHITAENKVSLPCYGETYPINLTVNDGSSTTTIVSGMHTSGTKEYFFLTPGKYTFTQTFLGGTESELNAVVSYAPVVASDSRTVALKQTVTLNSKGYATFSSATDVDIETSGVNVYAARISDNQIVMTKQENKYIPAGIGVMLYGGEAKANTKVVIKEKTNNEAITDNDLKPTTTSTTPVVDKSGVSGTIWALNGDEFLKYTADAFIANRAYLVTNVPAAKLSIVFDDETTGVANVDVNKAREGKYLENGRIVILKNGRKYNAAGQLMK